MSAAVRSPALVVLAGGTSRRLGTDKTQVVLDGSTLLDHAVAAVAEADPVVVVGPPAPTARDVVWTREEPVGSGPAAALQAGLATLASVRERRGARPADVVVLAADLPHAGVLAAELLRAESAASAHGLVVVDADLRPQWTSCLLTVAAQERLRAQPPAPDAALHTLLRPLDLAPVAAPPGATRDVDTPADLERELDARDEDPHDD